MKFNYFTTKIPFLGLFTMIFLVASCGSYEYVGYDNDGIYGQDNRRTVESPPQQQTEVETKNEGTYYKNYFSEKAQEYEYVFGNGEIFTDIDSYEGDYNEEIDTLNYNKSYAGWGQNNDNVIINVIDNGWNSWGWYNPWAWNSWYYSPRYSWGWNSWGWNVGFGYPYYGYGYGYPYYGYGYGYGYPYYNNNYYNRGYNSRNYAYNSGRRGSYLNRDLSTINGRTSATSRLNRSSSTVRSRNRSQVYDNNRSTRPRSTTRSNTGRNNSPRVTRPRSNTPRVSTPRSSTPKVSTPRRSSGSSSGTISRSSSSSSRSSGSTRSSSSSSSSRSSSRR